MDVAEYLKIFRRRWWLLALGVVVGTVAAGGFDLGQAPRYQATTRLLVAGASPGGVQAEDAFRQLSVDRATAYAQLVQTGPGLTLAAQAAGVADQDLEVTAEATADTPFISVTVQADTAATAQAVAAAYPVAIPRIVQTLDQVPLVDLPTITLLEPPALPTRPSSPQPLRDIPVAAALGLLLGLALAFLRESLDTRVRETTELERLSDASLLGAVPRELAGRPLPSLQQPRSGRAEAYRHVRTNLEFSGPSGMPGSLAITSASPGEGKSSLAANLAVAAAQAGRSVVVVDADLRKPSLARYFGVPARAGLAEVLCGSLRLDDVLMAVPETSVVLLPCGATPGFPSELLGSMAMTHVIDELESRFDLVVVDTPPVLPVSDALLIGVHVDGVVVVARMGETTRTCFKRAVESVRKVNATVLGVVGNAVIRHEEKAYGYGYGYGAAYGDTSAAVSVLGEEQPPVAAAPRRRDRRAGQARGRRTAAHAPVESMPADYPFFAAPEQPPVDQPLADHVFADQSFADQSFADQNLAAHPFFADPDMPADQLTVDELTVDQLPIEQLPLEPVQVEQVPLETVQVDYPYFVVPEQRPVHIDLDENLAGDR